METKEITREEELLEYRKKINNLSEDEKRKRDLYLKHLAAGELQGPPTGYSSIDKSWLKFFDDKDFDYEIPNCSIYDYMMQECSKYSGKIAMQFEGKKISYDTMFEKIEEVAKSLKQMGLKKGDTVSVCLPNIPEVAYVFYAINKIGCVANMLDPRSSEATLKDQIVDSNTEFLITLDSVDEKFNSIIDETKLKNVVSVSPLESFPKFVQFLAKKKDKELDVKMPNDKRFMSWKSFVSKGKSYKGETHEKFNESDPAVICYTGGTTGKPKGVIDGNKHLIAMVIENAKEHFNVAVGDTSLNIAPPWTYYGLSNCLNAFLCMGVNSIMIPKSGPNDLGWMIDKYKPNHIITVPSALLAVVKEPKLKDADLSFIKSIIVGADKLDINFEKEFNEFMKQHNSDCLVSKGYGMTEVTAAAAYTKLNNNIPGSVGIPFIAENVSIFNPETGNEVKTGESGEIAIKGPKNMMGYFESGDQQTSDVLKQHVDGSTWAHTSDIGHMDKDGNLYVDGRIKRMFVKNGFKIFAPEVEKIIMSHPAVIQCAVVPVPDKDNGNIAKAFIVLKDEFKIAQDKCEEEIKKLLADNVYDYEVPDLYEFRDYLPLTNMNKINFKELEEEEKNKLEEKGHSL